MVDQEMLQAISALMDSKLETLKEDLQLEIKQSKRELRNEIRKSTELVLDEVERVHGILDTHKADKSKHTA